MRTSGSLRRGTLAELLFEAENDGMTGTVAVAGPDRRGKVYVVEGRIAHARQSGQREFTDWLGLLGLVPADDDTVATTLASRLSTDLVLNAPMIRRLAREYVDRVCGDLLRVDEGEFRIEEGEAVPHGVIEAWKVAQVLLNAAATGHADKLESRPSLKDVRLRATTEGEVVLSRAEWRLAVEMARPMSAETLAQRVGAETRSVKRVLAGLLDRGLLSAGPGAALVAPEAKALPSEVTEKVDERNAGDGDDSDGGQDDSADRVAMSEALRSLSGGTVDPPKKGNGRRTLATVAEEQGATDPADDDDSGLELLEGDDAGADRRAGALRRLLGAMRS
ncbi:MAG: DUF4388 domain-containing protein [Actinomycetota bacterium]